MHLELPLGGLLLGLRAQILLSLLEEQSVPGMKVRAGRLLNADRLSGPIGNAGATYPLGRLVGDEPKNTDKG